MLGWGNITFWKNLFGDQDSGSEGATGSNGSGTGSGSQTNTSTDPGTKARLPDVPDTDTPIIIGFSVVVILIIIGILIFNEKPTAK